MWMLDEMFWLLLSELKEQQSRSYSLERVLLSFQA